MLRFLLIGGFLVGLSVSQAQSSTFITRPGQIAVTIHVVTNSSPDDLAPGYIFMTPFDQNDPTYQGGPQIFTSDGTLVWDGYQLVEKRALDTHVCDYLRSSGDHICFNDALPVNASGHSSGNIRFLDNTYTQITPDFGGVNGLNPPDIHELNTPAGYHGATMIQDTYQTVAMNLTAYDGPAAGYVLSGCIQDIDLRTRDVVFQWCSLDHIPVNQTYVNLKPPANGNVGKGTQYSPWDYFHLNSADKDANGDYLISSRHTDTLYKVAGANSTNPGSIIWYLGGKSNSFTFKDDLNFSRQHMGRWHRTEGSVTMVSLFDNAFDAGSVPTSRTAIASSGMVIAADTSSMTAVLMEQFAQPDGLLVASEGSLQLLSNGNRFLGWGAIPSFSEFDGSGTLIYHARFSNLRQNYRTYKFPWVAYPTTTPDLVAYAESCSSPVVVYLSWNGATEVSAWKIYGAPTKRGNFVLLGTFLKAGFETMVQLNNTAFISYVYAEAVEASGVSLDYTLETPTFVPVARLAASCNATQCVPGTNYTLPANSRASACALPNGTIAGRSFKAGKTRPRAVANL